MTSFDSGVYKIPAIPIEYLINGQTQRTRTNPLQLIVTTIPVAVTDSTDIEPIKEILREPIGIEEIYPYVLGALGLALILMAVLYFVRRKNRPKEIITPPTPIFKAHEIAQQKLEQLKAADLLARLAFKEYQSELTFILREYLENRYDIAALESTTGEIVRALKKAGFPDNWQTRLKDMLQKADMVKFAKADYPIRFHEDALQAVATFVEETKEKEEEILEEDSTNQAEESSE